MPLMDVLQGLQQPDVEGAMAQATAPGASGVPEFEANKTRWADFLTRMKTDPNFKQAVTQVGLGMMRTPQPGQNFFDTASAALNSGVQTLDALRARDRTWAQQDRKEGLETKDTESQIIARTANTQNETARTGLAAQELAQRNQQFKERMELDVRELEERMRSNRADEGIARTNANTNATGGGGRPSGDEYKIQGLTDEYVRGGMNATEARAKATREVMSTGKTRSSSPGALYQDFLSSQLTAWQDSFNNMGKEPTPELWAKFSDNAKKMVADAMGLEGPTPATPAAPAPSPTPRGAGIQGAAGSVNDAMKAKVEMLKQRGVQKEAIIKAITDDGFNPKDFGY